MRRRMLADATDPVVVARRDGARERHRDQQRLRRERMRTNNSALVSTGASTCFVRVYVPFPARPGIPHTFHSPLLYFPCRENSANVLSKGGLMMQRGTAHIAGRLGL